MSVDCYLGREYRPGSYNCLHFTADVWRDLTGHDIHAALQGLLGGALAARKLGRHHVRAFRALAGPLDPCLVLFQAGRTTPHIGVYLRGRVLHIRPREGVQHVPVHMAEIGFTKTRFILPC